MSVIDGRAESIANATPRAPHRAGTPHDDERVVTQTARRWWVAVSVLYLVSVVAYLVADWIPRFVGTFPIPTGPIVHYGSIGFVVVIGAVIIAAAAISAQSIGRRVGGIATAAAALFVSVLPIWDSILNPYSVWYLSEEPHYVPLATLGWGPMAAATSFIWMALVFVSWGLTRPVRGIGYIAIALIAVTAGAGYLMDFHYGSPFVDIVMQLVILVVLPGSVVAVALAGSRASDRRRLNDVAPVQQAAPGQNGQTNTMAVLSLVFAFVFSILGVVFGHVALSQIARTHEAGRGLAVAGLVVGYVALALGIAVAIWQLIVFQSIMSGLRI